MSKIHKLFFSFTILLATSLLLSNCKDDDPAPVNEEEVITTVRITLTPQGGGASVTLTYYDEDGGAGNIPPKTNASGSLAANTQYNAVITLLNETESPAEDMTEEIEEEATDHLFCFNVSSASLEIEYNDKDENEKPIGLSTTWLSGGASKGTINVVLRHQPGTKTGECPGTGESDIDVTFDIVIE